MMWILSNWKWIAAIVAMGAVFSAGNHMGASGVQQKWDAAVAASNAAQLEAIKKAESEKVKIRENTRRLNALVDALNHDDACKLGPDRVRIYREAQGGI